MELIKMQSLLCVVEGKIITRKVGHRPFAQMHLFFTRALHRPLSHGMQNLFYPRPIKSASV